MDEDRQPAQSAGQDQGTQARGSATPLWIRPLTLKSLRDRLTGQSRLVIAAAAVGYLLSPFSAYNDAVVNIPPSWFLAHWTARIVPVHVAVLAGLYYVLSNLLGIALMAWAFSRIKPRPSLRWALTGRQLLISLLYVLLTVALVWIGVGGIAKGVRQILVG